MRHNVYGKKLGRNKDERDRLFHSLAASLFTYGTIETSESKAKAIKGFVDRVINLAKEKKLSLLKSNLVDKNLRGRLIKEIVPKLGNRNSGYTSLVKLGTRLGDQTMMVRMSLIGAEESKPIKKESRIVNQESSKKIKKSSKFSEKKVSKINVKSRRSSLVRKPAKRRSKKA